MDIYITGKNSKGNDQKIQIPIIPEEIESSIEGKFAEYDIYKLGQVSVPNGKNLSELSWECFFPGEARKGMKFVRKWTDPATLDALMKYWAKYGKVVNVCITGTKINVDMRVSEYDSTVKSLNDYYYTVRFIDYEKISVSSTKRSTKTTKKKISKYTIYKGQVLVIPVPSSKLVSNSKVEELKKAMNKDGYSKLKVDKKLTSSMKSAMKKITIRTGRKGQVVKFVQKMVGVKQDGTCGSKTVSAIKTYQRKHKLTVTGVADYKTLLKMIGG